MTAILSKIFTFFKEVRVEAKRVSWPSRQETTKNTLIVLGFTVVVALFLGAFDFVFTMILERFII
ncbi:MAG: preprotein translocase subunit SecE [Candidatus Wildermuthbacteria bacterium RIFCSPLOWO2_01_FULL_47_18]|uniref:Protein translocase subunit SecE n=2 Tax=Candidatus Wildermuthiibacteriota TaxID=1817923 RepID=A0A1G2RJC5_9BACT|nr:MAG: preprotein translocase subunit SecE [Candidatus Wildermuthbacteria bacterium RIFCSPHIGHO2_02_FULL_48_16]OHA72946.1 MAG: preprotein translocase subunit SecE [Candidatus Wildermuthbacteria bacterium RIFCSPLOWO2_01_FULL_47_18]